MYFKTFLDSSKTQRRNIGNSEQLDSNKRNVTESYSTKMNEVLERYYIFIQDTEQGLYSKTAKFWIQYVYLIQLCLIFTRSVRTGVLDLHVFCLPEITNIFFAMNHLIYARWLVKYYDSLTKLLYFLFNIKRQGVVKPPEFSFK